MNIRAKSPKCSECNAKGVEPYVDLDGGWAASGALFESHWECPA